MLLTCSLLLQLLFLLPTRIESYKILVYNSKFSYSHSNFMGAIADVLVDAGHDVTSLIPTVTPDAADGTTKSRVIRVMADEVSWTTSRAHHSITETFDICGIGLAHYIKPKSTIITSSSSLLGWQFDELGIPPSLSFNPSQLCSRLDPHSIFDRLWNIVAELLIRLELYFTQSRTDAILRARFGEDYPRTMETASHAAYAFANSEPLIYFAQPILHRTLDIGGISASDPLPLDEKWLEVVNRRRRAVIISFGTIVRSTSMSSAAKEALTKTMSRFPGTTFIWKYEDLGDSFAVNVSAKVPNLVLSEWIPQNDLLAHPKVVAFISHGGAGSVQETARRGKPAIYIPLFGDQPRNAFAMEHNGLGKILSKHDLTDSAKISSLLQEILDDGRFAERTAQTARKLATKPFSPRELLVKYVEFAAEFGPSPSLRPASIDMPLVTIYNLDLVFVAAIVCISTLYVAFTLLIRVFLTCRHCGTPSKLKNS